MYKFTNLISALVFAAITIVVLIVAIPRIDRYLDIRAVEACSNSSSFVKENSEDNFTAKYPIETVYKDCISQTNH